VFFKYLIKYFKHQVLDSETGLLPFSQPKQVLLPFNNQFIMILPILDWMKRIFKKLLKEPHLKADNIELKKQQILSKFYQLEVTVLKKIA
jgi:hypothetical protein